MKKTKADQTEQRKLSFFFCVLIMLAFSVALPILLKTNTQVQYKSIYSGYSVGEIAEKNVYAKTSIDLVDSEATQEAKEEARSAVLPVFSFSNIANSRIIAKRTLVHKRNHFPLPHLGKAAEILEAVLKDGQGPPFADIHR